MGTNKEWVYSSQWLWQLMSVTMETNKAHRKRADGVEEGLETVVEQVSRLEQADRVARTEQADLVVWVEQAESETTKAQQAELKTITATRAEHSQKAKRG